MKLLPTYFLFQIGLAGGLLGLLPLDCRGKDAKNKASDLGQQVEAMTGGAHTRIIWNQSQDPKDSDPHSEGGALILKGFDSQDGLGERTLLSELGNYYRPLISTDGQTIVFTRMPTKANGARQPEILRTDWKGAPPVKLANGMATQCWRDPVTQVEWVYAMMARGPSSERKPTDMRLVRFPLERPELVEKIYDDLPLGDDNIQFSRDGRRGSGNFPFPNAGLFLIEGTTVTAQRLQKGCWPSMAPDNSHIAWVFHGDHRGADFFSDDGAKTWKVDFSPPQANGMEMYHPRWSNHPRYLVITGPYDTSAGHVKAIQFGGRMSEVFLGRFDASLKKVESWVQITKNDLGDNYPDAWIEGGDTAQLSEFGGSGSGEQKPAAERLAWPSNGDGIAFLWINHGAANTWRTPDGHTHQATIKRHGAARMGRCLEMLLQDGHVEIEEESKSDAPKLQVENPEASFEALVLPASSGRSAEQKGWSAIFQSPAFRIGTENGALVLAAAPGGETLGGEALPAKPFHLAVVRSAEGLSAFVNGIRTKLKPRTSVPDAPALKSMEIGGHWNGGLLNIAVYHRALGKEEVAKNAAAALRVAASLPAPPPQIKLLVRLRDATQAPSPESIAPYTSSLVTSKYDVEKVLSGDFHDDRVLVKHWGLLNKLAVTGNPSETGKAYELTLEKESAHRELTGERVTDDTSAFDLEPWFDVASPHVAPE